MARLVSDRAGKTDQVVLLPASIENPGKLPPGTYRMGVILGCASIFAFFTALMLVYYFRSQSPSHWTAIEVPNVMWVSTSLIVISSFVLERGRHSFRKGDWHGARAFFLATAWIGVAFVGCQLAGWWDLVRQGAYLAQNPHASFYYIFTGLHALHLIGGMVALFVMVSRRWKSREIIWSAAFYWHFLSVLWLALFATLELV